MSQVYHDDEWKRDDGKIPEAENIARAEMQRGLNRRYAMGSISLKAWRTNTDFLSNCDRDGEPFIPPTLNSPT